MLYVTDLYTETVFISLTVRASYASLTIKKRSEADEVTVGVVFLS